MLTGRIRDATRYLGAPRDWVPEKNGECGFLPIRDEVTSAGPSMLSAWELTPEEMARIAAGAPIILVVVGSVHPPVALMVGQPPKDEP
jgi:hypothetical protein